MKWQNHLIVGYIVSILFIALMWWKFDWYALSLSWDAPVTIVQILFLIALGSLVADLDHPIGKLHEIFMWIGVTIGVIGLFIFGLTEFTPFVTWVWKPFIAIGILLSAGTFYFAHYTNHRGFVHSIPFCVMYGAVIYLITGLNLQLGVLSFVACYSHLIADGEPFKIK